MSINSIAQSQDNRAIKYTDWEYDNNEIWIQDYSMHYENNFSLATGIIPCTRIRSISGTMPANGTISWSWRTNDEYGHFHFYINYVEKPLGDAKSIDSFSSLISYSVTKGDKIFWNYSRDSPPCGSGQGWLHINYIPNDNYTPNESRVEVNPVKTKIDEDNKSTEPISVNVDAKLVPVEKEFINESGYIILDLNCSTNGVKNVEVVFNLSNGIKLNKDYSGGFLEGITCVSDNGCYKCNASNEDMNLYFGKLGLDVTLPDNIDNMISLDKMNIKINNSDDYVLGSTMLCEFRCRNRICNLME